MTIRRIVSSLLATAALVLLIAGQAAAWYDETHMAVARAAGYPKWYNAAAADIARVKAGKREGYNHYSNHFPGAVITEAEVIGQISLYDTMDGKGHLYGAVVASLRNVLEADRNGKYAENHMAYCVHYIGDLSMPLHHTALNEFNKERHAKNDGIVNNEVMANLDRIRTYPIRIDAEADLVKEIARIANLSLALGLRMEAENRNMTPDEAYGQLGHSASLLRAVLEYRKRQPPPIFRDHDLHGKHSKR
jgi:hypothetical protein